MSLGLNIDTGGDLMREVRQIFSIENQYAMRLLECTTEGEAWDLQIEFERSVVARMRKGRIKSGPMPWYSRVIALCEARRAELQAAEAAQASGGASADFWKG